MTCKQCQEWWSPYLDAELDAETAAAVDEHLAACEACRNRFAGERLVEDHMRARLREGSMPPELWDSIRARVASRTRAPRLPLAWPLALAASVGLIALGSIYFGQGRSGDRPDNLQSQAPVLVVKKSMGDLLREATPRYAPFSDAQNRDFEQKLADAGRRILGVDVRIDPNVCPGHRIELVDVIERTDVPTGRSYVEVHLNCCGKPVLLALARLDCDNCVEELCAETDNCKRECKSACGKPDRDGPELEVESFATKGIIVAAVTADHYLDATRAAVRIGGA